MLHLALALLTASTYHVSPTGLSLEAALEQAKGKPNATIMIAKGEYVLPNMLLVGKDNAGLTITSEKGQRPVLIGGQPVGAWHPEGNLWVAQIPEWIAEAGSRLLTVNGQMRPRSRWPETGELIHESVFDVPWMSTTGGGWKRKPTDDELTTMRFKQGDLGEWFDPASAEVTVFHMWDDSCVGVKSIDMASRVVTFSSPTGHPPGAFGVHKYVVWNTSKGLTKPGQWFLDRRASRLFYWPKPGEKPSTTKGYLGTLPVLLAVRDVPNVTIRNLELQVSNVPLKAGGFGAGAYDGAITAANSPNLRIENVKVDNVAGTAIKTWACADLVVSRCRVTDTGAGGIHGEGDRAKIADNIVQRVGLMYPSAIGIWCGAKEGRIEHNEVTDTSYSAILGAGEGSVFEGNYIARAMNVMHDGGGIYFGFTKNVTLRGNLVEDIVDTGGYGASAYYLDEQAEGCIVEGNVSRNVVRPMQNHMARRNTIRNNLFMNAGEVHGDFAKCSDYTVEDNVIVASGAIILKRAGNGFASFRDNIIDARDGLTIVTLDQYAEKGRKKVASLAGNQFGPVKLTNVARRLWRVNVAGKPSRDWDLRSVGCRGVVR